MEISTIDFSTKKGPLITKYGTNIQKYIWWIIPFCIPLILCSTLAYLMREYTAEDALIYYRYIQNCLDGNGLVYNIGERFNGLTSPAYTYLSLLIAFLFNGNIQYSQIGMCALFLFLTCTLTFLLFYKIVPAKISIFPPLLLSSSVFFYKTFGMETMFFLFLILLAIYFFQKRSYCALSTICSLLLLTRGESLFLIIAFLFFYWQRHKALPEIKTYFIPVVILVLHFSFNYWYYGNLLPNTLSAKIYQGASGLWGRFAFVSHLPFIILGFCGQHIILPFVLIFLGILGIQTAWKYEIMRIMLIFCCLYCLFYIVLNIPDYFWYYGYVFLVLYFLIGFGFQHLDKILLTTKSVVLKRYRYLLISIIFGLVFCQQTMLAYKMLKKHPGTRAL